MGGRRRRRRARALFRFAAFFFDRLCLLCKCVCVSVCILYDDVYIMGDTRRGRRFQKESSSHALRAQQTYIIYSLFRIHVNAYIYILNMHIRQQRLMINYDLL